MKNHLTDKDLQQLGFDDEILRGLKEFDILPPITVHNGGVCTMQRRDLRLLLNRGMKLLIDTYRMVHLSHEAIEKARAAAHEFEAAPISEQFARDLDELLAPALNTEGALSVEE
jgi:hypothetical protein